MKISAIDQLVVVNDGDSYAASMGLIYPTNGGNAQYYETNGAGKVIKVQPQFADANGSRLIFYPIMYSAAWNKYLVPTGQITFRFNNRTAADAIIAQGTMEQYTNGTAVQSGTWNTASQGASAQTYAQVFKATTYTITNPNGTSVTLPALAIIGQLAYRTQSDISIYCTCEVDETTLVCKEDVEIRSLASENYKVIITATNNSVSGSNDTVINSADETITLSASLLKNGTSEGVSVSSYNWHKFGESTTLGSSQTLVVTEQMVGGVDEFVCDVTYNSNVYSASITINDIQDQFMINLGRKTYSDSTKATEVENSGILKPAYVVSYTPTVIDKRSGTAYSGAGSWTFDFVLKKADGTIHLSATAPSLPFDVTGSTVQAAGGLSVHVTANNSSI
jgi:hypothetical protein